LILSAFARTLLFAFEILTTPSRVGLHPKTHKVKIALAQRIAIGNDDVVEMDRSAVADGKLELCVQPAGSQSGPKTLKSANSENRPL